MRMTRSNPIPGMVEGAAQRPALASLTSTRGAGGREQREVEAFDVDPPSFVDDETVVHPELGLCLRLR